MADTLLIIFVSHRNDCSTNLNSLERLQVFGLFSFRRDLETFL
jgi:hypothetical protein